MSAHWRAQTVHTEPWGAHPLACPATALGMRPHWTGVHLLPAPLCTNAPGCLCGGCGSCFIVGEMLSICPPIRCPLATSLPPRGWARPSLLRGPVQACSSLEQEASRLCPLDPGKGCAGTEGRGNVTVEPMQKLEQKRPGALTPARNGAQSQCPEPCCHRETGRTESQVCFSLNNSNFGILSRKPAELEARGA